MKSLALILALSSIVSLNHSYESQWNRWPHRPDTKCSCELALKGSAWNASSFLRTSPIFVNSTKSYGPECNYNVDCITHCTGQIQVLTRDLSLDLIPRANLPINVTLGQYLCQENPEIDESKSRPVEVEGRMKLVCGGSKTLSIFKTLNWCRLKLRCRDGIFIGHE